MQHDEALGFAMLQFFRELHFIEASAAPHGGRTPSAVAVLSRAALH